MVFSYTVDESNLNAGIAGVGYERIGDRQTNIMNSHGLLLKKTGEDPMRQ